MEGTVELPSKFEFGPVLVTTEDEQAPSARARISEMERIKPRYTPRALEKQILSGVLTYVKLTKRKTSRKHSFFIFRTRIYLIGFSSMTLQICNRYKAFFLFISLSCCYSKTWQQYFIACISPAYVLRKCYIMESLWAHM